MQTYQRQASTAIPQQTNFTKKIEENDGATMFFIAEKQQKTVLNFSSDSLIVTEYCRQWNIKKILNLLNESSDSKFVTRN